MAGVFVRFFFSGGHGRWMVSVLRPPLSSDAAWHESGWQLSARSAENYRVEIIVKSEHQQYLMLGPDAWKSGVLVSEIPLRDQPNDFPVFQF